MKYKVKIITGFRRDQEYSIDAQEAHKAYYLFNNPEARTTFSNGIAIKGDQIQEIVPDYNGTMGWNPTHVLASDDYNELSDKGVDRELRKLMSAAQEIAKLGEPQDLNVPLTKLLEGKYLRLSAPTQRILKE